MHRLLRPVWYVLAVLFLVEAWFWERFGPWVRRLVDALPWAALKARIATVIERLPPIASLVLFAIPAALLIPFKLVGLALIAAGHVVLGAATFFAAKIVGFGVTAFLFHATEHKLMQVPGFPRVYAWVRGAYLWAHGLIDPYKAAVRARLRAMFGPLRERVRTWFAAEGGTGHFARAMRHLRARIQRR